LPHDKKEEGKSGEEGGVTSRIANRVKQSFIVAPVRRKGVSKKEKEQGQGERGLKFKKKSGIGI